MLQSLRGRLLIGVISLVIVGLVISDVVTYAALQNYLVGQLDSQLKTGHNAAISGLGGPNEGGGPASGSSLPGDTVVELVSPTGGLLLAKRLEFPGATPSRAFPVLPQTLPAATETSPAVVTLEGTGGISRYRAAIWPEDFFQGNYVVLAIPMSGVLSTLGQLLQLEALVSIGVVVATAILALLIIRIGLRPLERMGRVAQDIAAGDLWKHGSVNRVEVEIIRTRGNRVFPRIILYFLDFRECEFRQVLPKEFATVNHATTAHME